MLGRGPQSASPDPRKQLLGGGTASFDRATEGDSQTAKEIREDRSLREDLARHDAAEPYSEE